MELVIALDSIVADCSDNAVDSYLIVVDTSVLHHAAHADRNAVSATSVVNAASANIATDSRHFLTHSIDVIAMVKLCHACWELNLVVTAPSKLVTCSFSTFSFSSSHAGCHYSEVEVRKFLLKCSKLADWRDTLYPARPTL